MKPNNTPRQNNRISDRDIGRVIAGKLYQRPDHGVSPGRGERPLHEQRFSVWRIRPQRGGGTPEQATILDAMGKRARRGERDRLNASKTGLGRMDAQARINIRTSANRCGPVTMFAGWTGAACCCLAHQWPGMGRHR